MKNKGNLYILITVILWSTGGLLMKYIEGHALAINGARSILAYLVFVVYLKRWKIHLNKYVISAALCLTMTNILFVRANQLTTAANAIVLQYMAPVYVLIWDCIRQKRKPEKRQLIVIALAFAGMVLFFCDQLEGGHLLGNLLAILSGVTFSGVFFINSLPESSSPDASMLGFLISFAVGIPFLSDMTKLDVTGVIALLVLGIFQVGLAYVFYSKGSRLTSPVSASLIGLLEAILNPVWVFLFYGEKVGRFALLGGAVILFAVGWNVISVSKES